MSRFERLYARALVSDDPVRALARAARDRRLDADTRRRLASVDADGVRMTALLIARLRFERLLRGSPEAERWFDSDPAGFAAAFRRYHTTVPPTAAFPAAEAALFASWRLDQGRMRRMAALPESATQRELSGPTPRPMGVASAAVEPAPSSSATRPEPAKVWTSVDAAFAPGVTTRMR
jgi:hypothetical protein